MRFFLLFFLVEFIFGAYVIEEKWPKNTTLLTFFNKYNIDKKIYFNQSKTDKELCDEIIAGVTYQKLVEKDELLKVLIPISEEMQIILYKYKKKWYIDIIPISYKEISQTISLKIQSSPYNDIYKATLNKSLADEFMLAFKSSVNFRKIRKNNILAISYKQKIRLGRYFGSANILAAMIEVNKKRHYIFKNLDDYKYYDEKGKSLTNYLFKVPLKYRRISSHFTLKRWHPILHKYRAHLGVDYAAPRGTIVRASSSGKIIFRGRKGGYGKVIIIRHNYGFKTLYAHMSRFKGGLRVGSRVKQGQVIGYVGSTGRSTGPHLHFGLYKNNRAINPEKLVVIAKDKLRGRKKRKFLKFVKKYKKILLDAIKNDPKPLKIEDFPYYVKLKKD